MNQKTLLRNEVELSPKRFLAESSTKGVSAQDLRSKFQPIYHYRLFFGVQYTNLPIDLRFLLTAQAIEVYQDNRFNEAPFSDEEYQNLKDTLLAVCSDEKQRKLVAGVLEHGNSASFRRQLKDFVAKTIDVLKLLQGMNSKKRNNFIEVIFTTRNYLTHHTKELAPNAASGIELFYITQYLSLALQVCLMKEIGFSTQRLTEVIHKHESYRYMPSIQSQINLEKLIGHNN